MMSPIISSSRMLSFILSLGAGLFAAAPLTPAAGQTPSTSAAPAPAPAAAAPIDFTLNSITTSGVFKSADERGWFVALHFLLKTECPVCLRHTGEYLRRQDELPGVRQIFIKPDTDAEIKAWVEKLPDDLPAIYRDPDAALAKRFNVPFGYQFHGQTVHFPALILLGPDGREVFRHVGKNNSDRYSFDNLTQKINALTADPALAHWNLPEDRLVLGGHDPVSYFSSGGPLPGQAALPAWFRGVKYHFASAANRRAFAAAPQNYTPAFGGWCAMAMTQGQKVAADPASFKVTNNRLYVFYSKDGLTALTTWVKDEPANEKSAWTNWQTLTGGKK